jgi:hypothetical protein
MNPDAQVSSSLHEVDCLLKRLQDLAEGLWPVLSECTGTRIRPIARERWTDVFGPEAWQRN